MPPPISACQTAPASPKREAKENPGSWAPLTSTGVKGTLQRFWMELSSQDLSYFFPYGI